MPSVRIDVIEERQADRVIEGAIFDTQLALQLIGTKLVKYFPNPGKGADFEGIVESFDVCPANDGHPSSSTLVRR